jgi:hypothetical protein
VRLCIYVFVCVRYQRASSTSIATTEPSYSRSHYSLTPQPLLSKTIVITLQHHNHYCLTSQSLLCNTTVYTLQVCTNAKKKKIEGPHLVSALEVLCSSFTFAESLLCCLCPFQRLVAFQTQQCPYCVLARAS